MSKLYFTFKEFSNSFSLVEFSSFGNKLKDLILSFRKDLKGIIVLLSIKLEKEEGFVLGREFESLASSILFELSNSVVILF